MRIIETEPRDMSWMYNLKEDVQEDQITYEILNDHLNDPHHDGCMWRDYLPEVVAEKEDPADYCYCPACAPWQHEETEYNEQGGQCCEVVKDWIRWAKKEGKF